MRDVNANVAVELSDADLEGVTGGKKPARRNEATRPVWFGGQQGGGAMTAAGAGAGGCAGGNCG